MEQRPHIEQAECGECGETENFDHEQITSPDGNNGVARKITCKNCNEMGVVLITETGLSVAGAITYENASWNQNT